MLLKVKLFQKPLIYNVANSKGIIKIVQYTVRRKIGKPDSCLSIKAGNATPDGLNPVI